MRILVTGGNGNIAKMIRNNLSFQYNIVNLSHSDLNVLNLKDIEGYLKKNKFDILVHTAILGGRRTKEENGDVTHTNLLMMENLLHFADRFKMIINFDSAAIYDRSTDILNRKEEDLFTVPRDYYGFSKYVIYKRSLQYKNMYNFRIFNIFHINEEPDRFIKSCFISKQQPTSNPGPGPSPSPSPSPSLNQITIFEDKYFDFVYEDDFIKIVKYYFDNVDSPEKLEKTINICYEQKYKLSEIAEFILKDKSKIKVLNNNTNKNYSGENSCLKKLNIPLEGLEKSLHIYDMKMNNN